MPSTPCKTRVTRILLIALGCLSASGIGGATIQFESYFTSLEAWDVLDFKGDAIVNLSTDSTVPPEYGPEVLLVKGDHVLALAKSLRIFEGTILVLYKEQDPRDRDADGILVFNAQYGDDMSVEHNTKTIRPMIWLEQDNDSGVHLRAKGNDGNETVYAEQSGVGLVTDKWNKTNWIWQKVNLRGSMVSAKYWPAHEVEPVAWTLQTSLPEIRPGRIGFRIGSGDVAIAFFAYDSEDITPQAPAVYMTPQTEQAVAGQPIPLYLFCNIEFATGMYQFALEQDGEVVAETSVSAAFLGSQFEHQIVIVPPDSNSVWEHAIIIKGAVNTQGTRVVLSGPKGAAIASCELTCTDHGALLSRLAALQLQTSKKSGVISSIYDREAMHYEIARAHLALAASRLEEGSPEGAERALHYAANAVRQGRQWGEAPVESQRLWRTNTVLQTDAGPRVLVFGKLGTRADSVQFEFYGDGKLLGSGTGAQLRSGIMVQPYLGLYEVVCNAPDKVAANYPSQLIATIVEVKDSQILLNGEPFLVKGVNVHSLDQRSPERSLAMIRKLKQLGFNMLRGDHPPLWQVEMAYEENMAWSILAPFSCKATDEIFATLGESPMVAARDKTEEFIETYRDMPGVLLWNSCNEITNETTDFLVSMYPLYKHLDPYGRPVHYANLYGQDRWQGQDVMAVNYYFAPGQTPEDRHPLIERSIALAKAHGLPIIYTEYNSYHGPVPETGVQAIYGLFAWGIDNGMSGGFLYDKWMSDKHPGVFDQDLNVDPGMEAAFIDVFADARMEIMEHTEGGVKLQIVNKRPFTLRNFLIAFDGDNTVMDLPDIPPKEAAIITKPGLHETLTGQMQFITHHGFQCKVPFQI